MKKTNSFDSRSRYDKLLIITSKIYLQITFKFNIIFTFNKMNNYIFLKN